MTEPISDTLIAVFDFCTGLMLKGELDVHFLPAAPLEVGCVFKAFRPTRNDARSYFLEAEFILERDAMVRACLLPGLGTYGTGDYRIGRRPGDKIRIGLEVDPRSERFPDSAKAGRVVCTVRRADLEVFLRRTLDLVEIGEAEEARIIETSLDSALEEILSSGR